MFILFAMDSSDLDVDLLALGLGQLLLAVAADDAGSFSFTTLTPGHGTEGTLEGREIDFGSIFGAGNAPKRTQLCLSY